MDFPAQVASPLLPETSAARFTGTIPSAHIAKLYADRFQYDTSADFAGIDRIAIYECEQTGYRFFYPHSLAGKEELYRAIEDLEWTYQEDQWEHEAILDHIDADDTVLDVGCGRGAFLAKAKAHGVRSVTGIELNQSAAEYTRGRGIEVVESLIGDHARERPEHYDVVTAFQVLEHVPDPMPFLRDCVAALKPGGLLVIAVPNNDGFQQYDADDVLNQPPHHMGLWNRRSLAALAKLLPLRVSSIETEPLREKDWYQQVIERRYLPSAWQRKIYYRLGGAKIFRRFIDENARSIAGHTIMALYHKTGG